MCEFDYIHASDCDCDVANIRVYTGRLLRARLARATVSADRSHLEDWYEMCEAIPEGSCLAWLKSCGGRPGDHRDYHLLSRHREALRLRGSGDAAWRAVAAWRRHRTDASVRKFAEVDRLTEVYRGASRQGLGAEEADAAWAAIDQFRDRGPCRWAEGSLCDCPGCAQEAVLLGAAHDAERAEVEAVVALREALREAPWGAQPDGSFLTRQSSHVASGRYVHTLHAPGRGGPLAAAADDEHGGGARLTALRTVAEARAIREAARSEARAAQEAYCEALRLAARRLKKSRSLQYTPGQAWGTVELPGHILTRAGVPRRVSARGALHHAGLTMVEAQRLLSSAPGESYDSPGPELMLSLSRVTCAGLDA